MSTQPINQEELMKQPPPIDGAEPEDASATEEIAVEEVQLTVPITPAELDPDDDWAPQEGHQNLPYDLDEDSDEITGGTEPTDEYEHEPDDGSPGEPREERVDMLFVLIHGNHGHSSDWTCIRRELYNQFGPSVLVMSSSSNSFSTHEGVDVGGRNLTCEIAGFINQALQVGPRTLAKQRYAEFVKSDRFGVRGEHQLFDSPYAPPQPSKLHTKDVEAEKDLYLINAARIASEFICNGAHPLPITLIGHSLGGLFARNAIGWLYYHGFFPWIPQGLEEPDAMNPHASLLPEGLVTMCTPHLGSRRPGGSWMKATWKTMVHTVLNHANGQTGIELLLEDHKNNTYNRNAARIQSKNEEECAPLLSVMASPDSIYMKGLALFKRRTLVGITHFDALVPYCSAVVVGHNPYHTPNNRKEFAVVGSFGFTEEHNLVIAPYQDRSLSGRVNNELTALAHGGSTLDDQMAQQRTLPDGSVASPVNTKPSASVIGIPRSSGSVYYTDTTLQVEYLPEILTNLRSVHWRRLDIQFPKGPFVHELPIQKIRSKPVATLFTTEPGYGFIKMLTNLLKIDHSSDLHDISTPPDSTTEQEKIET